MKIKAWGLKCKTDGKFMANEYGEVLLYDTRRTARNAKLEDEIVTKFEIKESALKSQTKRAA